MDILEKIGKVIDWFEAVTNFLGSIVNLIKNVKIFIKRYIFKE